MTSEAQFTRMLAMRKVVAGRNVFNWASDILEGLEVSGPSRSSIRCVGGERTSVRGQPSIRSQRARKASAGQFSVGSFAIRNR